MLSFGHGLTFPTILALPSAFGIPIELAAQIVTAYALGRFAGTPPGGVLVDRLGVRVVMLLGPILIASAALGVVFAPVFALVLVAMFVAGMGDSLWQIGREIAGIEMVSQGQRGRLMSGFMGFNSAGMAIGPVVGGLLTDLIDYRAAYLLYAVMALVILAIALGTRTIPMTRRTVERTEAPRPMAGRLRALGSFAWAKGIPGLIRQIEP